MNVMFWERDVKEYMTVYNQPTMYYTHDEVLYVQIGNNHKLLNSRTEFYDECLILYDINTYKHHQ